VVVIERPRRGSTAERILEELDAAEEDFVEIRIEHDGSRSLPEFALAHPALEFPRELRNPNAGSQNRM
jgi:hypothetical protein